MTMVVLTTPDCPWCDKVKRLLEELHYQYVELDITKHEGLRLFMDALGIRTVPQVFNSHYRLGGYTELTTAYGEPRDEASKE